MSRRLTDVADKLAATTTAPPVVYIVDFENIPKTDVAALLDEANVRMVVLAANSTNTVTPQTLRTIEANPERVEVIIGRITRKEFVDKLVTAKIGEYAFRFPDAEIIVLANDKDYRDLADHLNDHWERAVPIRHVAPDAAGRGRGKQRPTGDKASAPEPSRQASGGKAGGGRRTRATTRPTAEAGKPAKKSAAPKAVPEAAAEAAADVPPTTKRRRPKTAKPAADKKSAKPAADKKSAKPADDTTTNPDADVICTLLAKMPAARRPKSGASLLNAVRNYREAMGLRARPTTIIKHLQARGLLDADATPVTYRLGD